MSTSMGEQNRGCRRGRRRISWTAIVDQREFVKLEQRRKEIGSPSRADFVLMLCDGNSVKSPCQRPESPSTPPPDGRRRSDRHLSEAARRKVIQEVRFATQSLSVDDANKAGQILEGVMNEYDIRRLLESECATEVWAAGEVVDRYAWAQSDLKRPSTSLDSYDLMERLMRAACHQAPPIRYRWEYNVMEFLFQNFPDQRISGKTPHEHMSDLTTGTPEPVAWRAYARLLRVYRTADANSLARDRLEGEALDSLTEGYDRATADGATVDEWAALAWLAYAVAEQTTDERKARRYVELARDALFKSQRDPTWGSRRLGRRIDELSTRLRCVSAAGDIPRTNKLPSGRMQRAMP